MTTSIRILTTSTLDSSPSLLISDADGSKTLINCGEGCQRSFLESASSLSKSNVSTSSSSGALKVKSVKRVCLTSLGHESLGGLPGFILTSADASEVARTNAIQKMATANNNQHHGGTKRKISSLEGDARADATQSAPPSLDVIGPVGTKAFLHSLRHFMRRDKFQVTPHEGQYDGCGDSEGAGAFKGKAGKKKKKRQEMNAGHIRVQSIPLSYSVPLLAPDSANGSRTISLPASSYIFTTPNVVGQFRPDKAKALGIPPGPIYGRLKAGKEVTYVDSKTNETKTAKPEDVLDEGSPGISVAVLYVPTVEVFEALKSNENLLNACRGCDDEKVKQDSDPNRPKLEVMVHITPREIFESSAYQAWLLGFSEDAVEHITMFTMTNFEGGSEECDGTPFRSSAVTGAMARASVDSDVYLPTFPVLDDNCEIQTNDDVTNTTDDNESGRRLKVIPGRPLMEYILIPRKRKGLVGGVSGDHKECYQDGILPCERKEIQDLVTSTGAAEAASRILSGVKVGSDEKKSTGSLTFTGTGSAIPCKHRNVTGKILRMTNGHAIMLDVGEGTTGQLLRCWKYEQRGDSGKREDPKDRCQRLRQRLIDIKAIWISHSHADHFLGILRMLRERSNALLQLGNDSAADPVVMMAPPAIFRFLAEYSSIDPRIRGTYAPVDCRDMTQNRANPAAATLLQELGITSCFSVPVAHCLHSYAVVIDGTPFGKVVYSGDCRPSVQLAEVAKSADLLIHEATFEDGMEAEAALKRHSTVGEALSIGKKMNVQGAIVLTHFSQRYPRIPPMPSSSQSGGIPVVFAFDFMQLTPANMQKASLLTSAVRLLYPEDAEDNGDEVEDLDIIMEGTSSNQPSAKDLLAVPGAFAAAAK